MSTIAVIERKTTESIDDVINAIKQYGADNVKLSYAHSIVFNSFHNNFNDVEKYIELFNVAGKDTLESILNEFIQNKTFIECAATKLDTSVEVIEEKILSVGLEKGVFFEVIPVNTSREYLYALAEAKLLRMYYIEHVKSIDVEFVLKYKDELDLDNLLHTTDKEEVKDLIKKIKGDDE